jgi:hypothetical protein
VVVVVDPLPSEGLVVVVAATPRVVVDVVGGVVDVVVETVGLVVVDTGGCAVLGVVAAGAGWVTGAVVVVVLVVVVVVEAVIGTPETVPVLAVQVPSLRQVMTVAVLAGGYR